MYFVLTTLNGIFENNTVGFEQQMWSGPYFYYIVPWVFTVTHPWVCFNTVKNLIFADILFHKFMIFRIHVFCKNFFLTYSVKICSDNFVNKYFSEDLNSWHCFLLSKKRDFTVKEWGESLFLRKKKQPLVVVCLFDHWRMFI